jgi:hypothetical protein
MPQLSHHGRIIMALYRFLPEKPLQKITLLQLS